MKRRRKRTRRVMPRPGGFEWVKIARDEWRRVIDPSWEPKPESCKYLGKYIKVTYRERDQRAQVIVKIRAEEVNETDAALLLRLYFDDPKARAIFGDVKVFEVKASPTNHNEFTATLSTDRRDVRHFAKPK